MIFYRSFFGGIEMKQYLRHIPAVHELQKSERFINMLNSLNIERDMLTQIIKEVIDHIREQLLKSEWSDETTEERFKAIIFHEAEQKAKNVRTFYLKKVINATGTVLHTNLGRARLSEKAISHVIAVAGSYSNLEYNITKGSRGSRHDIIEELIKQATGAEAAMVVNNNAAAVYLILRALAKDKQVIVSRGQLVEIGGSFRVSAIMEESGAQLVEVGTTNKTHLYDYENALNDETAMMMKVHTSNFKTIGFTDSVDTEELVELKKRFPHVLLYEDLGSGALYDFNQYQIGEEPVVKDVIGSGVDVVSFSGDKLLGGPQAGIIAGKKYIIDQLKKHQLARVLRVDKMTFAALEATLQDYILGDNAILDIPVVRDVLKTEEQMKQQASELYTTLSEASDDYVIEIGQDTSQIGGGTMPDVALPSIVCLIQHQNWQAHELARKLREGSPSIVTRIKEDRVVLDLRTITKEEQDVVIQQLLAVEAL